MTRDTLQIPTARSWRDIPQPVVPRAMSREGRWRLTLATIRVVGVTAMCVAMAYGAWLIVGSLAQNSKRMPAVAKATPMKPAILKTDGVLDNAWLAQTLGLPKNASLLELDLDRLQRRILGEPQVVTATLTRNFPDKLVVQITERVPIARVMTEWMGQHHALLVARDGVIYDGKNYSQATLDTLPWLDGVAVVPERAGFRPIAGMDIAAELLAKARLEAEQLYSTWAVVSLSRLTTDHQLEVRTKNDSTIIFNTREDYFRQLARLNYIWDELAKHPGVRAKIDLSLGDDVPVMVDMPADTTPPKGKPAAPEKPVARPARAETSIRLASATPVSTPTSFFVLPSPQPNSTNREL